jgi:hypothetical protein
MEAMKIRNDGMPEAHSSAGRSAAGRVADASRRQPTAAPPPPPPQRRLILSPSRSHSPSLIPHRRDHAICCRAQGGLAR